MSGIRAGALGHTGSPLDARDHHRGIPDGPQRLSGSPTHWHGGVGGLPRGDTVLAHRRGHTG